MNCSGNTYLDLKAIVNEDIYPLMEKLKAGGLDFKHSKPDPEIYFYTMEKMGIKPEDCYVVETSLWPAGGKACGSHCDLQKG